MSARKKIAPAILTRVLVGSARRCCLCFGLHGDFSEKKGQVAHIDHDRANHNEQNLVFLWEHHDTFDSSTSQSKGITKEEVVFYRDKLCEGVRAKLPAQASGKDRNAFAESEAVAVFLESARPHNRFNSGMLNGYEIQRACHADLLRIEPFVDRQLTWSGYILVCGEQALVDGHLVHLSGEDPLLLLPNAWAVVSTREVISMPPWLTGKLTPHRDTLSLDSEAVLKAIEAQHGIFVERAKHIYSFSHLTFQEYLTARYFVDNAGNSGLAKLVRQHITNGTWREVFLLITSMLDQADDFLLAMTQQVTNHRTDPDVGVLLAAIQESAASKNDLAALLHNTGVSPSYDRARLLTLALKLANEYMTLQEKVGGLPVTTKSSMVRHHTNDLNLSFGMANDLSRRLAHTPHTDDLDNAVLRTHIKLFPQSHAVKSNFGDSRRAINWLNQIRSKYVVVDAALNLALQPNLGTLVS
jgi:hypothetical protein